MDPIPLTLAVHVARGIPNQPMLHACALLSHHELQGPMCSLRVYLQGKSCEVVAERESHDTRNENSQSVCGWATPDRATRGSESAHHRTGGPASFQIVHILHPC